MRYERVTIIGVGLLGASLGLALKERRLAAHVTGVGHRQQSLDVARDRGAIDADSMDAAEAVRDAELIVLATPAALLLEKLDDVRTACSPEAVVTDVASTKAAICRHAQATWPSPRRFVGSHPMAGSEKFGAEHGQPGFYEGCVCLVEEADDLDAEARTAVCQLWKSVGARVVDVEAARHDAILARTSHLPHVVSSALAAIAARQGEVRAMVGQGYRDMTRIAGARPEIWRDIALTNRAALLDGVREMQQLLEEFHGLLEREDAAAIEGFFSEGRVAREQTAGS